MSTNNSQYFAFEIERQTFVVPLHTVQKVIRAVALVELPGVTGVAGLLNLQGEFIPVYDVRRLLGLNQRPLDRDDRIVIASIRQRTIALTVDQVHGVITFSNIRTWDVGLEAATGELHTRQVGSSAYGATLLLNLDSLIPHQNTEQLRPIDLQEASGARVRGWIRGQRTPSMAS